ncbi:hypothetical protein [Moorena sp. SIO4G3]|uniref:hypothetical protein n=1 Tax=Moorena sp. SIO4G3 TaxID=2607821 RepID=UPI00142A1D72|nr:hypothetical protein [Moorena sp. SIO4G3]NEO77811.1 hypothetical protein [Moorena sp. SIO4G3]
MDSSGADRRSRGSDDDNNQVLVVAITPCLDAVAHGGNPQDRAASLNFWGVSPPSKGQSDRITSGSV